VSGYGPPPPPPPPPSSRPKPWFAIAVAVVGSIVVAIGFALAAGVTLGMLFWQLLANVVMVVFVQELRWYGPGILDASHELWQWVLWLGVCGAALMGLAGVLLTRSGTAFPRPHRRGAAGS
jgi:hypothetical protein